MERQPAIRSRLIKYKKERNGPVQKIGKDKQMRKENKAAGIRLAAVLLAAASLWMAQPQKACAVGADTAIAQGVDVSMHNGAVDWGKVASDGMKFAFIKAGSTKSGVDPYFASNITNAQAAGLRTGVYLYSYATTPEAAAEEAALVLQWIDGYTVNFPVVFDIEDPCHKNLSDQQLIDIINAFCTVIDAEGYYPMVYSSKNMFAGKLAICGWDKWVAQYNDSCEYDNNVCFWQYSSHGQVNGFSTRADVNYQYKDYSQLIIPEGFVEHGGNVRFYRNWRMQRGFVDYNGTRYFLDGAGNLVCGWLINETGTYYLSPEDGSMATGIYLIEDQPYYFDESGILLRNQYIELEGRSYHTTQEGVLVEDTASAAQGVAES